MRCERCGMAIKKYKDQKAGKYDLGQIKTDIANRGRTENIHDGDLEIQIWKEPYEDKVAICVTGYDGNEEWSATGTYGLDEFMSSEESSFNEMVRETIYGF